MKKRDILLLIILVILIIIIIALFNYKKPDIDSNWYGKVLNEQKQMNLQSVEKCTYNNQEVYYFIQGCCDIISFVYDTTGKKICEFGGFAPRNTCPDFNIKKTNCENIWIR